MAGACLIYPKYGFSLAASIGSRLFRSHRLLDVGDGRSVKSSSRCLYEPNVPTCGLLVKR